MKAKRIIALLIAIMLAFSIVTVLSACGNEEPVADDPTVDEPEIPEEDPENPEDSPPTTDDPTTDDPTEDEPTTDDPATDDPTEDDPTTDDPTTDDPTTDDPTKDDPTTDDPTEDDPTTDDPTEDDPTIDDPTTDDPTTDDPTEENKEIVLVKDGVGYFKFVVASGYTSDVNRAVDTLISDISKLGVSSERLFDTADTLTDCEILIGTVQSRGEQYKLDHRAYGYEGYAIKAIDGKVLILAGSEDALLKALDSFKKDILGITKKTKVLTDVSMTAEQDIVVIQDNYAVESVTIGQNDLKDYVLVSKDGEYAEKTTATAVQDLLYKKVGIWLEIVDPTADYQNKIIIDLTTAKTCKSDKGFILEIKDGDILVDCGFANKIEEATLAFFMTEITSSQNKNPSFKDNYKFEKVDYKNIYYKDFGAKGDGYTDDFIAIKACHDLANEFGHTVHATSSATYYFGKGSGYETITVNTDTYWHGCSFIFDDHEIKAPPRDPATGNTTGKGDPEYYTHIFTVSSNSETLTYTGSSVPIKTLKEGDTNVGFAPGYRAMVVPFNANVKHFIRYGANQNNGDPQYEILIVDAEGNIDPTTPVLWNYDTITKVEVYERDDDPITISGGDSKDDRTHIETIFNGAESYYSYYERNIYITRSNVTLTNIEHTIVDEGDTGAPYRGFTSVEHSDNVVIDNCIFQCPKTYYTIGSAGTSVNMGTYEIHANYSNNVIWQNCSQSNFFEPDGSIKFNGMMGTNYCKNLFFDNMFVCSFDAHCGTYNGTIKNSTLEHINFIGEGTIKLENVTVHANATKTAINLRNDYGCTWQGDAYLDGVTLKYYERGMQNLTVFKCSWVNHDFGYQTYLPENVYINNLKSVLIEYYIDYNGERIEKVVEENEAPIHFAQGLESYINGNIANPNETRFPIVDQIKCYCDDGFNDTDGDGLCDNNKCGFPETANEFININPYNPTKNIYITNSPGLKFIMPKTQQFESTRVYIENKEFDWFAVGTLVIPTK